MIFEPNCFTSWSNSSLLFCELHGVPKSFRNMDILLGPHYICHMLIYMCVQHSWGKAPHSRVLSVCLFVFLCLSHVIGINAADNN